VASISKRPNGKWLARYRAVKGGQQITKQFDRKADGQAWLASQLDALNKVRTSTLEPLA